MSEIDDEYYDLCQDALNRMRKASENGTGVRLSADEIQAFRVTILGEMWNTPDPRERDAAINMPNGGGGE
jgi:hypothetical protein